MIKVPTIDMQADQTQLKAIETTIVHSIINDESQLQILGANRRQTIQYNEKELREAAHAEIANTGSVAEFERPSKRKKSALIDDKAKQSRDRNREHAKNTRLRKKAYVYKLKELLDQLCDQKKSDEQDRAAVGQKLYSSYAARKNATLLFLTYRATGVRDRSMWESIMEENVSVTLPITPYRYFQKNEVRGNNRILIGIDSVIADTSSLIIMMESIGQGTPAWRDAMLRGELSRMIYHTSKEDTLASGDIVMCRFLLKIEGPEQFVGEKHICVQPGMLYCRFSSFDKITSAEMVFDVMGMMQQLQRAVQGCNDNGIVPNTLEMALQPSSEARVIIKSDPPYPILHVNQAWTRALGYPQSAVENCEMMKMLGLSSVDARCIVELAYGCSLGRPGSAIVTAGRSPCSDLSISPILPSSWYTKLLPLKAGSERNSHILLVMVNLSPTMSMTRGNNFL